MNWDNYEFDGAIEALQDGHVIRTGRTEIPPGLSALIFDTEENTILAYGDSRFKDGEIAEDEPPSLPKAIELAGRDYREERVFDYTVETPDAVSRFLMEESVNLEIEFEDIYRVTLDEELTVEGRTLETTYEELQNELLSELDA